MHCIKKTWPQGKIYFIILDAKISELNWIPSPLPAKIQQQKAYI